mmetsp:Transcript_34261/g.49781  ORF Transcript_34261/g.49781 Transcript_34261/m.49781 type:complete len:212 (+) Transcript_34261:431-1066(+)
MLLRPPQLLVRRSMRNRPKLRRRLSERLQRRLLLSRPQSRLRRSRRSSLPLPSLPLPSLLLLLRLRRRRRRVDLIWVRSLRPIRRTRPSLLPPLQHQLLLWPRSSLLPLLSLLRLLQRRRKSRRPPPSPSFRSVLSLLHPSPHLRRSPHPFLHRLLLLSRRKSRKPLLSRSSPLAPASPSLLLKRRLPPHQCQLPSLLPRSLSMTWISKTQ